jgi:hypothetical protein
MQQAASDVMHHPEVFDRLNNFSKETFGMFCVTTDKTHFHPKRYGRPIMKTGRPYRLKNSNQAVLHFRQTTIDLAKYIADNWSQNHERSNNNNGN